MHKKKAIQTCRRMFFFKIKQKKIATNKNKLLNYLGFWLYEQDEDMGIFLVEILYITTQLIAEPIFIIIKKGNVYHLKILS